MVPPSGGRRGAGLTFFFKFARKDQLDQVLREDIKVPVFIPLFSQACPAGL